MVKRYQYFGKQLRKLRKEKGLTLEVLSQLLGGSPCPAQLSRYSNGEDLPVHNYDVVRMARAMNCTVAEKERLCEAYLRDVMNTRGLDPEVWIVKIR